MLFSVTIAIFSDGLYEGIHKLLEHYFDMLRKILILFYH